MYKVIWSIITLNINTVPQIKYLPIKQPHTPSTWATYPQPSIYRPSNHKKLQQVYNKLFLVVTAAVGMDHVNYDNNINHIIYPLLDMKS